MDLKKLFTPTTLFLGTLVLATTLTAVSNAEPLVGPPPMPGPPPHFLAAQLNLSDQQLQLLKATRVARHDSGSDVRELQQQLQQLVHSDQYSDADAEALIQQITETMATDMLTRAAAENAFYMSLDDEQKAQLVELSTQFGPIVHGFRTGGRPPIGVHDQLLLQQSSQ